MENENNHEVKVVTFRATDNPGPVKHAEDEIAQHLDNGFKIHSIINLGDGTMVMVMLIKPPSPMMDRGTIPFGVKRYYTVRDDNGE